MDPSGTAELATGTLAAGTRLAGYRVESVVGRGGMATVYRAVDEGLQRTVALKVFSPAVADDPSLRSRFIREARLAASLDHEHVVPVHASGEADGRLFIAMRFVEGRDLATMIAAEAPLEPARTIGLLAGVARALDAAHALGMVHRDVKPGNILVAERDGVEHAYLADFGITHERSGGTGLTRDGQFVGSVAYAAPEQILGGEVEARTDVYGLACVAFECLTGVQPYRRPSDVTLLFAHLNEPPPAVSAFRPELVPLDDVVAWGMAKAADARPASAGAFLRSLETRFGAISMVTTSGAGDAAPADEVPSLPREATSFVGRDAEITQIGALLAEARAVVLVGPGGVGKTRLAGRVARAHASGYPGGVVVVPLAAVSDPDLVLPAIAEQAGVRAVAGEPLETALARRFRARRSLLVLDNVEHLVAAAGVIGGLLDACRDLTVLSTGRRGFRLEGERELAVQPLPVSVSPHADPRDLADQPAVRLFLDRARTSRTGFRPTEADLRTVAAICARLEGLPLAIELAAARIRLLGPTTMLARLDAPLGFLEGGPSTSDERHRTLRATIRWSDSLLDADERRLFVTMACFTGGWTLEAVEAVSASAACAPAAHPSSTCSSGCSTTAW